MTKKTKLEKCPDDFTCKENDAVCNRNIDFIETCGEDYEIIRSILNTANKYTIFYMWNILYGRILDISGYNFSDITRYAPEDTPREYHKEAIIRGYIDLMKYYKREIAVTDEINRKHEEYKKTDEYKAKQQQPAPPEPQPQPETAQSESETHIIKFEVGKTYPETIRAIYTGRKYTVIERTAKTITVQRVDTDSWDYAYDNHITSTLEITTLYAHYDGRCHLEDFLPNMEQLRLSYDRGVIYANSMTVHELSTAITEAISKANELEKAQSQLAPSKPEVIDVEAHDITETTQPEELPELKAIHGGMNLEILQQDIAAKKHNKRVFASINNPEMMDAVLKNAHSTAIVQFRILAGMSELHASNIPDYYLAAEVVNHLYPDYKPAQDILRAPFLEDPSRYSLRNYRKEHENYSFYKNTKKWLNECRRKNSSIIMQCQSYDDIKIMLIHISVEGILLQAQYDRINLGKSLIRDTEETRNDYANAYIMKLKARREKKSKQTTPTTQPAVTAPALPANIEDKPAPATNHRNSKPAKPQLTREAIDKCTSHDEIVDLLSNFKKSEISSFMASIGIYLGVIGTARLPVKLPKLISYCAAKILQKRNAPQQPTTPNTPKSKIYYTTPAPAVKQDKHGQLMFIFEEEAQRAQHEVITPSKKRAPTPARRGKKRCHRHSVKVKAL